MKPHEKKKKSDWIIYVCEILVLCLMLFPVLLISVYAIPAADDFANSTLMKLCMEKNHHSSYFLASLQMAYDLYKNTSGYYFASFANYFISPMLRWGINGLRIAVVILNLFFYFSLCCFVIYMTAIVCQVKDKKITMGICVLTVFAFTNNYTYNETWEWYCVLIGYVFVVAVMLWGIIFFVRAIRKGKMPDIVLASLIGFLVSGGSLNITALNCLAYLITGFIGIKIYNNKKAAFICFGCALTGAMVNVLAPGNYIRHEGISQSYPIIGALKSAAWLCWSRFQYLLFQTPFALLLVILFLSAVVFFHYNYKTINPLFLLLFVIAGIIAVNYPVCLGYNQEHFPDRCIWVEDCAIYLGTFLGTVNFAGWVKKRGIEIRFQKDVQICLFISCLFFVCNLGGQRDFDSYTTVQMIKQLRKGEIKECVHFWEDFFEEIECSDGREVVIERDELIENQFIYAPSVREDWVLGILASYYDKDRVSVIVNK